MITRGCLNPIGLDIIKLAQRMKYYNNPQNNIKPFTHHGELSCLCPICGSRTRYRRDAVTGTTQFITCHICKYFLLKNKENKWQIYDSQNKLIDYYSFTNGSPFHDDGTVKEWTRSPENSTLVDATKRLEDLGL